MCFICGRGNCCPSFHSADEQAAFAPAEQAYHVFLAVVEKCREEYNATNEDDTG